MKKDFMESRLEVILLDSTNIICTSGCITIQVDPNNPDDLNEVDPVH